MNRVRILLSFLVLLMFAQHSGAQPNIVTQCVTTAVAGGTGDAITIPKLPCVPTTTLLLLSTTAANATTVPTISPVGGLTQPIVNYDGSPLTAGQLVAGAKNMLTNNGVNWYLLVPGKITATATSAVPCPSILNYGGSGNDTADNISALNAALAANNCVSFPSGVFRFNSSINYAFSSTNPQAFTIQGSGQDVTVLHFPNAVGTGLNITKNGYSQNVHVHDLTMTTGQSSDTAIKVTQSKVAGAAIQSGMGSNDITRVTLRSDEGYWEETAPNTTHVWATGVHILNDSLWDFVSLAIYGQTAIGPPSARLGQGVMLESTNTTNIPVIFNFTRANFNWLAQGIQIGNFVQGINVSQSNFVGIDKGVWVPPGVLNVVQVTVSGSQFGFCTRSIETDAAVSDIFVANNLIYVPTNGLGFSMGGPADATTIVGNQFVGQADPYAVGSAGVYLTPASFDAIGHVISGNTFTKLESGIHLLDNVVGANVYGNIFSNNGITNILSSSQNQSTSITGGTNIGVPQHVAVTGAVNNGSGIVRLTVASTNDMKNGQQMLVNGVGGITGLGTNGEVFVGPIKVIDGTHIDLPTALFSGVYTSGGYVDSLVP